MALPGRSSTRGAAGSIPRLASDAARAALRHSNRVEGGGPRTAIDVFFQRQEGEVTRFLVCRTKTTVPYPGCAHFFLYEGLRVQASYDRKHLPSWAELETKIKFLLDRFHEMSEAEGERDGSRTRLID